MTLMFPLSVLFLCVFCISCLDFKLVNFKRAIVKTAVTTLFFGSSILPTIAVPTTQVYVYKSGKAPYLASGSASDSKDDKYPGSKKDSTFLRALSSCKTRCQQPGEGLAKNDCVQDCQDQTCMSYEQCSFRIKSTMGNQI